MYAIYEFKETLRELFIETASLVEEDISFLKNQKIILDDAFFLKSFTKISEIDEFEYKIEELVSLFQKNGISFTVVQNGTMFAHEQQTLEVLKTTENAKWELLCRNYLPSMIDKEQDYHEYKDRLDEELTPLLQLLNHANPEEAGRGEQLRTVFQRLKVDHIRAPKIKENQMLWLYDHGFGSAIGSSPLMFIYPNVTQIISHFDFSKQKFYFYDLNEFAANMGSTPESLRHILFACFCSNVSHLSKNEKMRVQKFIETRETNRLRFSQGLMREDVKELKTKIQSILKLFEGKEIQGDSASSSTLSEFLKLDKKKDFELIKCHFLSSQVLTDHADLICYPGKSPLAKKQYCFETNLKDLLVFYCMHSIPDSIISLLGANCKNSYVLPPGFVSNKSLQKFKGEYFLEFLAICLSKLGPLIGEKLDMKYTLFVDSLTEIQLTVPDIGKKKDRLFEIWQSSTFQSQTGGFNQNTKIESIRSSMSTAQRSEVMTMTCERHDILFSIYESIKNFQYKSHKSEKPTVVLSHFWFRASELSNFVILNLLEILGYLDMKTGKLSFITEQLVKIVPSEYIEESIILLELIRSSSFDGSGTSGFSSKSDSEETPEVHYQVSDSELKLLFSKKELEKLKSIKNVSADMESAYLKNRIISSNFSIIEKTAYEFWLQSNSDGLDFDYLSVIRSALTISETKKIELISLFFLLANPEKETTTHFDFRSEELLEKIELIKRSLNTVVQTNLTIAFLRTTTKRDFALISRTTEKLLFSKRYSSRTSAFIKQLIAKFLLYKEMKKKNFPGTKLMAKSLLNEGRDKSGENVSSIYPSLAKCHRLFDSFFKLGEIVFGISEETKNNRFWKNMLESKGLLNELFEFYQK